MSKKQQVLSEEVLEQIAGGFDTNSPMFKVGVGIAAGLVGLVGGASVATGIGYGIWGRGKSKAEEGLKNAVSDLEALKKAIKELQLQPIANSVGEDKITALNNQLSAIGITGSYKLDAGTSTWIFNKTEDK